MPIESEGVSKKLRESKGILRLIRLLRTCLVCENKGMFVNGYDRWVQSKRHRLWFSTKTHINSVILILKLNFTSLSTTHILMYMFLNEVKFNLRIWITLLT